MGVIEEEAIDLLRPAPPFTFRSRIQPQSLATNDFMDFVQLYVNYYVRWLRQRVEAGPAGP